MADKNGIKNASKNAVSKVCDKYGREITLKNNCRSAREDAHKSRNEFQKNVCPTNLSKIGAGVDNNTGIDWYRDFGTNFSDYHELPDGEDELCYRGKPSVRATRALKNNSEFKRNIRHLGGNPRDTNPGFQCCYHPDTGALSQSSSFDYDAGQSYREQIEEGIKQYNPFSDTEHEKLDMKPTDEFGENYDHIDMSSKRNVDSTPHYPGPKPVPGPIPETK